MATSAQIRTLKAMSLASGYGRWTQTRGMAIANAMNEKVKVSGGSGWEWNTDTTPRKVRLYTHNPDQELGRQMMHAALSDEALDEKGLKLRWYAWQPGEECLAQTFTASWVEKIKNGANKLMTGDSKQGCEYCRQEPLADAEKTPTQMVPETAFGASVTRQVEDKTPFRDTTLDELQAEVARRQAEAEVTAPVLTEESRAAVEPVGAPMEPTDTPSAPILQSTPPAAIKPLLSECPTCHKPGKGQSAKKKSSSVYAHFRSYPEHADTASAVPV